MKIIMVSDIKKDDSGQTELHIIIAFTHSTIITSTQHKTKKKHKNLQRNTFCLVSQSQISPPLLISHLRKHRRKKENKIKLIQKGEGKEEKQGTHKQIRWQIWRENRREKARNAGIDWL